MSATAATAALKRTPLHDLHVARGAKMVPFAGFAMPLNYPPGILREHLHTRRAAGLFDVSHMGQVRLLGPNHATLAAALEALVPGDILQLAPGRQRYTQLLNADGGIIDDVMVTRPQGAGEEGELGLVVNAAQTDADIAHIAPRLPHGVRLEVLEARALLALQGPTAVKVLERLAPAAARLGFMTAARVRVGAFECDVSRSGYTGEDGFEIAASARDAPELASLLLAEDGVEPVGLGARDSLRLEAGLCLYGHDIDPTTSPVEAGLTWSIPPRRRRDGGFPGAARIARELAGGLARTRVGFKLAGRAPAREGSEVHAPGGERIGSVTSGGYAPSLAQPIAMGYVRLAEAVPATPVDLVVRGKPLAAHVAPLPFVPHRYHRSR